MGRGQGTGTGGAWTGKQAMKNKAKREAAKGEAKTAAPVVSVAPDEAAVTRLSDFLGFPEQRVRDMTKENYVKEMLSDPRHTKTFAQIREEYGFENTGKTTNRAFAERLTGALASRKDSKFRVKGAGGQTLAYPLQNIPREPVPAGTRTINVKGRSGFIIVQGPMGTVFNSSRK